MVVGGPVIPMHIIRNLEESILNPKLTGLMSEDGYRILRQVICDFIVSGFDQKLSLHPLIADSFHLSTIFM